MHKNGKLIELLSDYKPINQELIWEYRMAIAQESIAHMYIQKNTPPFTFAKWKAYHFSRLKLIISNLFK